jgi:hypothetical protein
MDVLCDYCGKLHFKPTGSYCPERTKAYQKGLEWGISRISAFKLLKKMLTFGLGG